MKYFLLVVIKQVLSCHQLPTTTSVVLQDPPAETERSVGRPAGTESFLWHTRSSSQIGILMYDVAFTCSTHNCALVDSCIIDGDDICWTLDTLLLEMLFSLLFYG